MTHTLQNVWRVWLIRHAQTNWNDEGRFCGRTDIPLSPRGKTQAQWIATRLRYLIPRPAAIYSSDLSRARETAEVIAAPFVTQVITSLSWREIDFGDWEGLTYPEVEARFPAHLGFFTRPDLFAPFNGEALSHVVQRAHDALTAALREQPPLRDIIIVSHAGTLRALLCMLLGMSLSRQWQLRIDTASISAVDLSFDEDGALLASLALLNMSENT